MYQKDTVFYLKNEKKDGFFGVIIEGDFLIAVEIEEGLTPDEGKEKLALLKQAILTSSFSHLADFEKFIEEKIQKYNFPANISLSAGYIKGNILYLKTIGSGKIYIKRENKVGKIIEKEQSASGYIHEQDTYLFTANCFIQTCGGEEKLKEMLNYKKPQEIIDELSIQPKGDNDQGLVALFLNLSEEKEAIDNKLEEADMFISKTNLRDKFLFPLKKLYLKTQEYSLRAGEKKKYTLIAVIIIFLVFVWSVGLGYSRRNETAMEKNIKSTKTSILEKLNRAEDSAFIDLSKALGLISDAKKELAKLKKDLSNKKLKETEEINNLIKNTENKILKKEEKEYKEFFDLAVDNKEAKGTSLFLDQDNLSILDKAQGIIYSLSIEKKSLDKNQFSEIKKTQKIARYKDDLFLFTEDGFYKINVGGKINKIIEKDSDWGKIVDIWVYNGNIYALDIIKDQIYKYLVAESGYSAKTAYFKGGTSAFKDANSMAIDSSIYVGFPDYVFKFTAGSQDEFKTIFPESNISIKKIYTNKELEKVYAWDKSRGAIYILTKNGSYEREINSNILKKISDFVIYQDNAYLLSESKIYFINIK